MIRSNPKVDENNEDPNIDNYIYKCDLCGKFITALEWTNNKFYYLDNNQGSEACDGCWTRIFRGD